MYRGCNGLQQLVAKLEESKSKSPTRRSWKSEIHFLGGFSVRGVSAWMLILICKIRKRTMIDLGNGISGMNP